MASTRILGDPIRDSSCYHIVSRVVGGFPILGDRERDEFRDLLDKTLRFTSLELLGWCCMKDHFHVLIEAPDGAALRASLPEDEVFARVRKLFGQTYLDDVHRRLEAAEQPNADRRRTLTMEQLKGQFYSVPKFMHMLKRHFTIWYNKQHRRRGTLWENRYGSLLVERSRPALGAVAAYIDLNPVRAGLVDDPADYRWCGYAEAAGGSRKARAALVSILDESGPKQAFESYQQLLRDDDGRIGRAADPRQIARLLKARKKLTLAQMLRCRVRYFSDGEAIGSNSFIEAVFADNVDFFSPNRKSGARAMGYGDWGGLYSMRALSVNVIQPCEEA